ncbi:GntR family transcriptional regulator [Bifidobacterium choloepi]|uniref:GntR family transcriptional regulator n=1 Tax=Bifidobacterium choloepi TaxID=2614131 RepID=A0A6I5NHI4_9BIFI|nr:GntR family transcriptional regulator [Bifidobacterium choloepi]NEG69773.1 GntR family transcriptional regulator [Bifidobacterium choloepi]
MGAYTYTEQVAEDLKRQITNGELRPGQKMQSESRLAEAYHVSRNTVRRALDQLRQANLIDKRNGSGSYVTFEGAAMGDAASWTDATVRSGTPTTTELISLELVNRPAMLDGKSDEAEFYRICRRRKLQDHPVSLETSFLPATTALREIISAHGGLIDGSIYHTVSAAGMAPLSGHLDVSAKAIGDDAAKLDASPADVFLFSRRFNYRLHGVLVEYVESFLDPRHFSIHVTINGGQS